MDTSKSKLAITEIDALPVVMTPMDVAAVLRVSRNRAYEIVRSHGFPSFKVGNLYRIQKSKFIQWMDEAA